MLEPEPTTAPEREERPRRPDGRPLHVSWSQLTTYAQCGAKYRYRYLDRLPQEPQGPFIGGRAVHGAVEFGEPEGYWRDERTLGWVQQRGLELFDEGVREEGGPDRVRWGGRKDRDGVPNEGYLWWRHQIPIFLKHWAQLRRLDEINGLRVLPGGTEMIVRVNLPPNGELLEVRIDAAMFEDEEGQPIVRDYKAGKVGGADARQLAIYAWGLREGPGIEARLGEFAYLRRAGEVVRYPLDHLIEQVPGWFRKYALGLEAGIYPIEPNQFCSSCPVRTYCPHGQTLK